MPRFFPSAAYTLLVLCLLAGPAWGDANAVWWDSARNEAERDGFQLIDTNELSDLVGSNSDTIILDARADYEFEAGRIPGSINMEFDLGDRTDLSQEKRQALKDLLGPDKQQRLVIYCRSFRWLRSSIAARWAVRLGYTNVFRYPGGLHDWKKEFPTRVVGEEAIKKVLAVGDKFPACRVAVLNGDEDRHYLNLPDDAKWLDLSELTARFVLIQLYNTMCSDCVDETKSLNRFFRKVEADPVLKGQLKIIGLGIYDSNRAVVQFKRHYDVLYPLFSDKHGQIFECLGQAELPLAYLVRANGDSTWTIEMIKRGYFEPDDKFHKTLRQTVMRSEELD